MGQRPPARLKNLCFPAHDGVGPWRRPSRSSRRAARTDDGQIVAARYGPGKGVFLENRGRAFEVWREPFVELRVPPLFNLRRDPFERAQHNSNTCNDWFLARS